MVPSKAGIMVSTRRPFRFIRLQSILSVSSIVFIAAVLPGTSTEAFSSLQQSVSSLSTWRATIGAPVTFHSDHVPAKSWHHHHCRYHDCRPYHLASRWEWEGDDIRWSSKLQRNLRRSLDFARQPARNSIILLNIAVYLYSVITDVAWIRGQYPTAWPSQALSIVLDVILGRSKNGPLTRDFVYASFLVQQQPHRLLTAGFLHANIIHLLVNMDSLRRLPTWMETGLGAPLYLVTFTLSIVASFLADLVINLSSNGLASSVVGASGGICGLYGLYYICLVRMGNTRAAWAVLTNVGLLLGLGLLMPKVSNSGHAGGFVAGIVLGLLLGPRYRKSYALRRKNSLEYDIYSRDYRTAMGFDKVPSDRGLLPLSWTVAALVAVMLSQARFRSIPRLIVQGLLRPGSVLELVYRRSI